MKTCPDCLICKSDQEFYSRFKKSKFILSTYCKDCWKVRVKISKQGKVAKQYRDLDSKLKNLLTKARLRVKTFNENLTTEYLKNLWVNQKGLCVYSGLPLELEANHPHAVSLDRVDSSIGYEVGNVQLVSSSVNRMKQEFSEEFFLSLCESVTNNKLKTTQVLEPYDADPIVNTSCKILAS